ncbi:TonB-dependent receptor [uncultured Parasphingorhabdus sp.]|uniref:TonB-dependent receptor n=1 Tax=uncultured Parasphingorhabdus sp. TaxID=2709694 RepID=UPI002AA89366|nr:TonB-dependent receptor [uncultured Parasphingorhabdus sp.]
MHTVKAALLVGTVFAAGPVWAQVAGDEQAAGAASQRNPQVDSQPIIVTARKREERLVDVPLTITAFNADYIKEAGLENVSDVALQTPGFSFRQGYGRTGSGDGGAASRPAIRGMSNILGAANAGFFVDGVFVSGNITSYQLDNLERVEVIRGPQAALFGRQTFSGAINFVTRKPNEEFRGQISQTIAQYDHYETSGFVSGPLTDNAFFEVSGRYYSFGGDYVNADTGKRDINDQKSWNVGAKLRLTPNPNLEVILQGAYGQDQDKGYATYKVGSNNLNCYLPQVTGTVFGTIALNANRSRGYFCGEVEQPTQLAYNNDAIEALGYDGLNRSYFRSDATIVQTFDNDWSITSVTAYNGSVNQNGYDNDLSPSVNPSITIEGSQTHDFSQNIRIQTPQSSRLRGLVGAYYYRQRDGKGYNVNVTPTSPIFGQRERFNSDDGVNNYAIYGLLELDATDKLSLTAEARYQIDEILGSTENDQNNLGISPATNQRKATFKSFLPRVTARYELAPRWNLYGSIAKGNKPGGFNDLPTDSQQTFIDDFETRGFDVFKEEEVWSYELGTKGELPNGIYFNVAAFYLDWRQQQLSQSQPYGRPDGTFNTVPFVVNAGASEIKGIEVELSGNLTDWLSFRAGYAYNDAVFTDFYDENTEELLDTDGRPSFLDADFSITNPADVDGPNGQVAGNRLPQTPAHQLNLSGMAEFPVSTNVKLFLRGDFAYETNRYAQVHNLARTGDSYNLNLRAGFEVNKINVTFFVNNVLEDRTPLVVTRLFDFSRGLLVPDPVRSFASFANRRFTFYRDFTVAAPRKRQFGLTARYEF